MAAKPLKEVLPTGNPVVDMYKSRKMTNVRPHLLKALEAGDGPSVLDALTGKQKAFVEEYLIDLNATQAILRAGYNTKNPKLDSYELMRNPGIRFAIDYLKSIRRENSDVTSDYVLTEIAKIVEKTKDGNPNAALRGLELLAKHLGMFIERKEVSGPNGEAIAYQQKIKEDVADFTTAITRLANRAKAA